ncbi:MAG TPA: thiamine pyrophosphate-dependent enzyme, partial [Candidatus Tectomicrobia bacterium]
NLTGVHRIAGDRRDRGEELIRFGPTDFTAVARSFGVRGIRVEQPGEIAAALQQAIATNGPVVVDVVTALEPRAPEPWAPPRERRAARGSQSVAVQDRPPPRWPGCRIALSVVRLKIGAFALSPGLVLGLRGHDGLAMVP